MSMIRSELAAVVLRVNATVGQSVQTGDEVVVLESMKMEIPVIAGVSGSVKEILVTEGDMVDEGQAVMELA